jgi:hypothetical protein
LAQKNGLEVIATAVRRHEVLLQRADEQIPHSVGRVLLALATFVADDAEGCK